MDSAVSCSTDPIGAQDSLERHTGALDCSRHGAAAWVRPALAGRALGMGRGHRRGTVAWRVGGQVLFARRASAVPRPHVGRAGGG